MYRWERFTEGGRRVLTLAQQEAERLKHSYIGVEDIYVGLLAEGNGVAAEALTILGLDVETAREDVGRVIRDNREFRVVESVVPTSRVKKVIDLAFDEARKLGQDTVDTEHLLLAIVIEGESLPVHIMADRGVSRDAVQQEVDRVRAARATDR
jgi:ATP-dependent Clp protease ATP-binding subunit ClpC